MEGEKCPTEGVMKGTFFVPETIQKRENTDIQPPNGNPPMGRM